MGNKYGLSANKMAARICNRDDNLYKHSVVKNIIDMYMKEIRKAVIKGERVQITGVGTIIPEVKTHMRHCYLPTCQNVVDDSPYTKVKITQNDALRLEMNQTLQENIANGIWGLEKRRFDTQQMNILKQGGFIPEDAEEAVETVDDDDECLDE